MALHNAVPQGATVPWGTAWRIISWYSNVGIPFIDYGVNSSMLGVFITLIHNAHIVTPN